MWLHSLFCVVKVRFFVGKSMETRNYFAFNPRNEFVIVLFVEVWIRFSSRSRGMSSASYDVEVRFRWWRDSVVDEDVTLWLKASSRCRWWQGNVAIDEEIPSLMKSLGCWWRRMLLTARSGCWWRGHYLKLWCFGCLLWD